MTVFIALTITITIVLAQQQCQTALYSQTGQSCLTNCNSMFASCARSQCFVLCAQQESFSSNQQACLTSAQNGCTQAQISNSACNCVNPPASTNPTVAPGNNNGAYGGNSNNNNNDQAYTPTVNNNYNNNNNNQNNNNYNGGGYNQGGNYCAYPPCSTTVSPTVIAAAAGGSAGGVVLLIVIILLAICLVRRRRRVVKDSPVAMDVNKANVAENNPLFEQNGMSKENPIFYATQSDLGAPSSSSPPVAAFSGMPPPPSSDYGTQSNFNTVDFAKQDPKAALYPNLSEQALPVLQSRPSQVGRINDERMLSTRFDSPPLYGDEQGENANGLYPGVAKI